VPYCGQHLPSQPISIVTIVRDSWDLDARTVPHTQEPSPSTADPTLTAVRTPVTGRLRSFWKRVLAEPAQLVRDQTALEEIALEAELLALSTNQPVIAQSSDSTDNALHALPDWLPVRMAKDVLLHKTARATTK